MDPPSEKSVHALKRAAVRSAIMNHPAHASTIELSEGGLTVRIAADRGASILSMSARSSLGVQTPVITRAVPGEDERLKPPCFVMAPWTNRVKDAAFEFKGKRHQLRASSADGSAIHGDVRSRPFRILDRSPVSARLRFESVEHENVNFPWSFACEVRYEIEQRGRALRVDVAILNTDKAEFPCGCGLHPYFARFGASRKTSRVRISAGVGARYPSRSNIPVGKAGADGLTRALRAGFFAGPPVDDVFAGFDGRGFITGESRVTISASPEHGHLVVYVPRNAMGDDEPFIAVEPVTMVNDGFNLFERGEQNTGVRVLKPGQWLRTWTRFEVS